MPRQLRVEFPGALCHVMSRGDRREAIFLDDVESGREEFKRQMLERMQGKRGEQHAGDLRRESAAARAERIIAEELAR